MSSIHNKAYQTKERNTGIFTIMSLHDVLQITTGGYGFYKVMPMFWFGQCFYFLNIT